MQQALAILHSAEDTGVLQKLHLALRYPGTRRRTPQLSSKAGHARPDSGGEVGEREERDLDGRVGRGRHMAAFAAG